MTTYRNKDISKFAICNKLISRGAPGSSSDLYRRNPSILGIKLINETEYSSSDIVGISVNGQRHNRLPVQTNLVVSAARANAKIVTDNAANRNRQF